MASIGSFQPLVGAFPNRGVAAIRQGSEERQKPLLGLISWERTQKRNPYNLYTLYKFFRGDFGDQKGGPKRAIFGHKKFIVFSCP